MDLFLRCTSTYFRVGKREMERYETRVSDSCSLPLLVSLDDEADINDVWSHSTSVLGRIPDAYSSSTVCRTSILHVFTVLLLSYFAACLV